VRPAACLQALVRSAIGLEHRLAGHQPPQYADSGVHPPATRHGTTTTPSTQRREPAAPPREHRNQEGAAQHAHANNPRRASSSRSEAHRPPTRARKARTLRRHDSRLRQHPTNGRTTGHKATKPSMKIEEVDPLPDRHKATQQQSGQSVTPRRPNTSRWRPADSERRPPQDSDAIIKAPHRQGALEST